MKLIINGKLKEAEILSENRESLFQWKSNKSMSFDLNLVNAAGEKIGHINSKDMMLSPKFEIQINGQDCGTITNKTKFLTDEFLYQQKGWKLIKKSSVKELTVVTESGDTVFTFRSSKDRTSKFDNCELELVNEADLLPALCMLEAVFCLMESTMEASVAAGTMAALS